MIIDIHTHILKPGYVPRWMEAPRDIRGWSENAKERRSRMHSIEEHFNAMEQVDKAIVLGGPEEYTSDYVRKHPDKIIGFAWVNPLERGASRYVRYCVKELGLKGLKLIPILMHFFPNDEKTYPIYEIAQELEIPVMFHMGQLPRDMDTSSIRCLSISWMWPRTSPT